MYTAKCHASKSHQGSPYPVLADQTGAVGADTAESERVLARFITPDSIPSNLFLATIPPFGSCAGRFLSGGEDRRLNTPFAGALAVPKRKKISQLLVVVSGSESISTYLRGRENQTDS